MVKRVQCRRPSKTKGKSKNGGGVRRKHPLHKEENSIFKRGKKHPPLSGKEYHKHLVQIGKYISSSNPLPYIYYIYIYGREHFTSLKAIKRRERMEKVFHWGENLSLGLKSLSFSETLFFPPTGGCKGLNHVEFRPK